MSVLCTTVLKLFLSFQVGHKDWIQVIRLGSKCLYHWAFPVILVQSLNQNLSRGHVCGISRDVKLFPSEQLGAQGKIQLWTNPSLVFFGKAPVSLAA